MNSLFSHKIPQYIIYFNIYFIKSVCGVKALYIFLSYSHCAKNIHGTNKLLMV